MKMKTVKEVSEITGVTIRTLHHYHHIGLLNPTCITPAGYRLYDDKALQKLYSILLFRELKFSLKEIQQILEFPNFDIQAALEQQIGLLKLQRERLDAVISQACQMQKVGVNYMSFQAFDEKELQEYAQEVKKRWGHTEAYQEYQSRKGNNPEIAQPDKQLRDIFAEFGSIKEKDAKSQQAQDLVKKLQNHITNRYYTCTKPILQSLGLMYIAGDEMTQNIDAMGGEGTAQFVHRAIEFYCQ